MNLLNTDVVEHFFILIYVFLFIMAYLIGSIPFSYLVAKLFKGVDIRKVGSGNVGATNVIRSCGMVYGIIAFLLDSFKAGLVYFVSLYYVSFDFALILGVVAVIGHCHSVFLNFKGGKGVACSTGLFFFLDPVMCLLLILIFLIINRLTSYVSLASIIVVALAPILAYIRMRNLVITITLACLALFVIYKHKANIIRLKNGEESKVRLFSK